MINFVLGVVVGAVTLAIILVGIVVVCCFLPRKDT